MIAYLPFQVERCARRRRTRSTSSPGVAQGMSAPPFGVGVEITHWNGMPIARAVAVNADRFAGSNIAARLARGVDSLTIRSLRIHLPPDEEWVTVSYLDADGVRRELREPWLVAPQRSRRWPTPTAVTTAAASMGLDLHADETGRARALLYAPRGRRADARQPGHRAVGRAGRGGRRGALDDAAGLPGPQRRDRRRAPSATCGSSPSASRTRPRSWPSSCAWSSCCRRRA